jgi:uncharacterized protein YdeI (YjbR/CyaY-like superfamily)
MTTNASDFFRIGCGRCPLGGTPECKVLRYPAELALLRTMLLDGGLTEECKWGVPCYTYNGTNVALLSAVKAGCVVSFLKGSLITTGNNILEFAGEHSAIAKVFRTDSVARIDAHQAVLQRIIEEAIQIEQLGLTVPKVATQQDIPEELREAFEANPELRTAFFALPKGKQRGYIIHFSGAKQAATRRSRIASCTANIVLGIGLHDKYSSNKRNH